MKIDHRVYHVVGRGGFSNGEGRLDLFFMEDVSNLKSAVVFVGLPLGSFHFRGWTPSRFSWVWNGQPFIVVTFLVKPLMGWWQPSSNENWRAWDHLCRLWTHHVSERQGRQHIPWRQRLVYVQDALCRMRTRKTHCDRCALQPHRHRIPVQPLIIVPIARFICQTCSRIICKTLVILKVRYILYLPSVARTVSTFTISGFTRKMNHVSLRLAVQHAGVQVLPQQKPPPVVFGLHSPAKLVQ